MYSIVLFIVETSLSGLSGSGESPTSAVDRISKTVSSGIRPVNVTRSAIPSSLGEHDELVVGVAAAHEDEVHVVAARAHDRRRRAERQVDPVLRAHDAQVRAEVALAVAPGSDRRPLAKSIGVRAGANDSHPAGGDMAAPYRGLTVRLVRRHDVVGERIRRALQQHQGSVRNP